MPAAPTGARLLAAVFLPFAAGYYVSFLFRNVNSVVFPELTQAFDLSPGTLGLLTSVYFLTFAGAQIPLGVLIDRYGPRRVNATMRFLIAGSQPIGALLGGLIGEVAGVQYSLVVGVLGMLAAFVWLLLSPLRTLRRPPEAEARPETVDLEPAIAV